MKQTSPCPSKHEALNANPSTTKQTKSLLKKSAKGGEMTQTLYVHMNKMKKYIKNKK
jgi:hypothetical protein